MGKENFRQVMSKFKCLGVYIVICQAKFRLKLSNTVLEIMRRAHLTVTKSKLLDKENSFGTKAVGDADFLFLSLH